MKSIVRFGLLCAAIFVASLASAQKARYTMKIENLTNSSSINVLSFSWGASNPATIGPDGKPSQGRVSISSFNIMKSFDAFSTPMFLACAQGTIFPAARFQGFYGDSMVPFVDLMLKDVVVESIQHSGSGGTSLTESVSFAFGKARLNGVDIIGPELAKLPNLDQLIASMTAKPAPKAKAKVTVK